MSKALVRMDDRNVCVNCIAWRPKKDAAHAFGGCARGGETTTRWGDKAFVHYTTDLQTCRLFEPLPKAPTVY